MKISIVGYSGSGKTTLASFLGDRLSLPVLSLDKINWSKGWEIRDRDQGKREVECFLDNNQSWIIDGNYSKFDLKRRLTESDTIYLLDFNRFACLKRCYQRKKEYKGRVRPGMADGCLERLNYEMIMWILYRGRGWRVAAYYNRIKNMYKDKVVIIKNQRELDELYKRLSDELSAK